MRSQVSSLAFANLAMVGWRGAGLLAPFWMAGLGATGGGGGGTPGADD